jgi:hypothetical protein
MMADLWAGGPTVVEVLCGLASEFFWLGSRDGGLVAVATAEAVAAAVVAAEEAVEAVAEGNHPNQKAPAHREVLPHSSLPVDSGGVKPET